jgi:hypothetical protein
MSLCITVVTAEGVAVAGESRQTQVIGGVNRVGSDNGVKVFELTPTVLAVTAGWAFLKAQGTPSVRSIASLVEDFKPTIPVGSTVLETAVLMWTHLNTLYQEHIATYPAAALAPEVIALSFTVSGYNVDSRIAEMYPFTIPSAAQPQTPDRTSDNPGAWWIGTWDVVSRIVNGYDYRALDLPFVRAANQNNNTGTTELGGLVYMIGWSAMTLQDAIDFAVGMIQITITVQRFTAGTLNQMGGTLNVGGPIDVAVVQPGRTVHWVQRKELHP